MLGATSSRAVVQGEYGVGKTSFTSLLKTVLADHGVLTHARPVRVIRDLRAREFEAEVVRALLDIRASLPDDQRPRESAEDGVGPDGRVRQAALAKQLGLVKSSISELVARLEHHRVLRLARESARGGRELRLSPDAEVAFGVAPAVTATA